MSTPQTPKFIATKVVIDMSTGRVLERKGYWYSGPIAEAKKGREQVSQASKDQVGMGEYTGNLAKTYNTNQQAYKSAGDTAAKTYFAPPTDPSGLNAYNKSQFELAKSGIARNEADQLGVGERMLAQRGFNNSPGALSSLLNTASRNTADQINNAYSTALGNQQQLGLAGINYNTNMQSLYNPLSAIGTSNQALSGGAQSGALRSQMGSGFGDVMGGIGSMASLAMTPFGGGKGVFGLTK